MTELGDITREQLGDDTTDEDLELFRAAVHAFMSTTGASETDAIRHVCSGDDWRTRANDLIVAGAGE